LAGLRRGEIWWADCPNRDAPNLVTAVPFSWSKLIRSTAAGFKP